MFFYRNNFRKPLMMKFWKIDRKIWIQFKIHHIHDRLINRSWNRSSTWSSDDDERFSVFQNNGRSHRGKHSFSRLNFIRFTANCAEHIGNARFDGEIVHFIVEEKSCTRNDNFTSIKSVQSRGDCNCISFFVDD